MTQISKVIWAKRNSYTILNEDIDENIEIEEASVESDYSSYLNVLLLSGEINGDVANKITKILLSMNHLNKENDVYKPIHFIINSTGGSIVDAWQICDVMDIIDYPIITIGVGEIASAALLIFVNGEPGFRILSHRTSVMSHQYSWGVAGKMDDLISASKEFDNIYKRMELHFKEKTGLSKKTIRKKLLSGLDNWMTPEEAKKYHLADEIFDFKKKKPFFYVNNIKDWNKIKNKKLNKG